MQPIVHVTTFVDSGGGMQTLVRRHRLHDPELGLSPAVIAIFEPTGRKSPDFGLGAAWWWSPARIRRCYANGVHSRTRGAVVVYHNGWAMPLLAPGDGALRRVAYLHAAWFHFDRAVATMAPWCDGIICISPELKERVRMAAPRFPPERIWVVAAPVEPSTTLALPEHRAAGSQHRLRIGVVGRLERKDKRVDRLPDLVRHLCNEGGRCEWHLIGDGRERQWLERRTRGVAPVVFHGWLTGDAYWRALNMLDVIVFLSDSEGAPIALLEAMHCGVLPLFPQIGGKGEELARRVASCCVYPPGDMPAAARQLKAWCGENLETLRTRARNGVAAHTPAAYHAAYGEAVQSVRKLPRLSHDTTWRRLAWSDWLPMAVVGRYYERALWR